MAGEKKHRVLQDKAVVQDPIRRALQENEDWHRDLVEHSQDLLCIHDLQGRLLSVNPAPARVLGYTVEELLKVSMRELVAPEFRAQFDAYLMQVERVGEARGLMAVMTRSGERRIWEYHNTLRTEGVAAPIVRGLAHDVTSRIKAERQAREVNELNRQIISSISEGLVVYDRDLRCVIWNPFIEKLTGVPATEVIGKSFEQIVVRVSGQIPKISSWKDRLFKGETIVVPDREIFDASGGKHWVAVRRSPLCGAQGEITGFITALQDVNDRHIAEDKLRSSEENYRMFVAQSSEGIFRAELDAPIPLDLPEDEMVHRILHQSYMAEVNDAMARMYGLSSGKEVAGKRLTEMLVVDDPNNIQLTRDYIRSGFRVLERKSHEVDALGNRKVFMNSMIGIVEEGKLLRSWGIQRDVTEKVKLERANKQAEEALRQSDERFRVALLGSPICVFNQDRDLRYTWVYNLQDGWMDQDFLGKTDEDVLDPEDAARLTTLKRRVLETGISAREEVTVTARGHTFYYDLAVEPLRDASGRVVGITCACTDITHLREVMEQLREAKDRLTEEKLYLEQTIDTELGFGEIVGQSKSLKAVMQNVAKVAASDAAALLLGETGTGKELFARQIHSRSNRRNQSFIKMNCAAIPSGLLESELFGHEKGAFTGAFARKIGRIELADHGTIFLDEIGEIPLELQPKLLRVLQDQEFERLGGTRTIKVDFRLIAATNRDLLRAVHEKQFRSDLYYRLNVFPIRVPALRDRSEDIPPLIEHFVAKCGARMNKSITSIPKSTMAALMRWEWPGNIRELENFVERSVILTQGSVLQAPLAELAHSR